MAITSRALAFASRWFDERTVARVFEPLIADWQREWQDTPSSRRWWVSVRAMSAFLCAVTVSSPSIVMTPIPQSVALPVAKRIAIFCLIVATVLGLPLALKLEPRLLDATWLETWLLRILPGTLMIAFPFSMVIAIDAIRRDDSISVRVKRSAAVKLALMAFLIAFTAEGFVIPLASQKWLEVSTPEGWNVPEPQPQQSSTVALWRNPERTTAIVPNQYTRAGEIRRTLITRTVASVMPVLLIWLRWTMLERPRIRRYWPLPGGLMTSVVVVAFYAAYFGGFMIENELRWRAGNGLWLPLVIFGAWALVEQRQAVRVNLQEA